jgi:hypothetical protein
VAFTAVDALEYDLPLDADLVQPPRRLEHSAIIAAMVRQAPAVASVIDN